MYKLSASVGITLSGSSGDVTISNSGVLSINGATGTGAITNVAKTNLANTFILNQVITNKEPKLTLTDTDGGSSVIEKNQIIFTSASGNVQTWTSSDNPSTINFPTSNGTLALTSQTVRGINGVQGFVGLCGGTGISITPSLTFFDSFDISNTGVISFNGNTGAITGVSTLTNTGPNGAFITLTGSTGNINIGNRGVHSVNGITGALFLSEGSNITIGTCLATREITISATGGSATSDGSAIIYNLYPNLPINGLCAGDIISYNGSCAWNPTPREYLVTPSIWQTRKTSTNGYPTSTLRKSGEGTLEIQGATAVVGELIQLSLDGEFNMVNPLKDPLNLP